MNILFVSLTFPDRLNPERGTYNQALCAALAERHTVHVVAPRPWYEWVQTRRAGHCYGPAPDTLASGVHARFPVFWYLPRLVPQMRGEALWHSMRAAVAQAAAHRRPDLVVSYWAYPDAASGLRAASHLGVPSVAIVGGSDVLLLPKDPRQGDAVRRVLSETSTVVTVSDGLRRAAIDLGIPQHRVRTIRQGIDTARFSPGDRNEARRRLKLPIDAETLVWVGRMAPVKNLDLLITAVAIAAKNRPNLRLHLIGDGECRAALVARVASEALTSIVRFEGAVGHDKLADWYRGADSVVLTSHSEGLPNVLREGLACGTPFVATDVGDIRELAPLEGSQLTAPGDATAFAKAIEHVLDDVGQVNRNSLGQHARRTWHACADEFTSLFEELTRPQQPGTSDIERRIAS